MSVKAHGATWATSEIDAEHYQKFMQAQKGPVPTPIFQYATETTASPDTVNANLDYSGAAVEFTVAPSSTQVFRLMRMIVSIGDTSGMQAQDYGNIAGGITNGVLVKVKDADGDLLDLTDGVPITTNAEWGQLCYDVDVKTWGSGNELLVSRWTFAKAGYPIRLDGSAGEYLAIILEDDLRGLLTHYFLFQGYIENATGY